MAEYTLQCSICGAGTEVTEAAADQVAAVKSDSLYICSQCTHKIKYESEQNMK